MKLLTGPLVSNANQSPVPVGNNPIDRHFHRPSANVSRLQIKYTIFCRGSVVKALGSTGEAFFSAVGAKGANASVFHPLENIAIMSEDGLDVPLLIPARFLKGLDSSMNTIPMLKICTPPPDMYNMNACIGRLFAGEIAMSHARFSFSAAYDDEFSGLDFVEVLEVYRL